MSMGEKEFFIGLITAEDGHVERARLAWDAESLTFNDLDDKPEDESKHSTSSQNLDSFEDVISDFCRHMDGMKPSIFMLLQIMPKISAAIADDSIGKEAKKLGRPVLIESKAEVFEFERRHLAKFNDAFRDLDSSKAFQQLAPGIFLVGLVSLFDAFIGKLLRSLFLAKPEIIDGSNISLNLSQISEMGSVEAARDFVIRKEIESVLRNSHIEHFKWLESKVGMPFDKGLNCWPEFVEICERRNLWTHNGGVASQQYLDVCKENGVDLTGVSFGDRLPVTARYLSRAQSVFYEIGLKLGHTLWRKVKPGDLRDADIELNQTAFDLIRRRAFRLAIALLEFGVQQKRHAEDMTRRMMVVNLANALKLSGNKEKAVKVLDAEDWSAVGDNFRLCVSAVKEDLDETVELMKRIGDGDAVGSSGYHDWPVFWGVREETEFKVVYEEIFGHPFEPEGQEVQTDSRAEMTANTNDVEKGDSD